MTSPFPFCLEWKCGTLVKSFRRMLVSFILVAALDGCPCGLSFTYLL